MSRARALPYLWYPLFFGTAIILFGAMLRAGFPPAVALYAPIALVACSTLLLQSWFPARLEWKSTWHDVRADTAFIAVVQVFIPRTLAALAVLILSDRAHAHAPSGWWPHAWPLAAQTLLMVLCVDLMRYWLHRACHYFAFLWKLHEVHHSPNILYSLNVGRFHPFEKALHFCLDSVPFLLLGVAPEVIASYFLVYAVNGFFQHSNVRLRYGWLNYVVASAETHRWHHARNPRIACCNFGNTTIVWDLIFGTWYLPKGQEVGEIGIMDLTYPQSFWSQMLAPFPRRADYEQRGVFKSRLIGGLLKLHLRLVWLIRSRKIAAAAKNPMRVQHALLARIVHENRNTAFGRQHGFATIANYQEFIKRVSVHDYEALRPYVEAQISGEDDALTSESPHRYVRTSGTAGQPKDIPLTRSHLKALRRIHQTAVACQHRVYPDAFGGGILAIIGAAHEGVLANGKSFGSASGIVAESTPALVRDKFVLPSQVLAVTDSRLKYLLILRLALARPDITYLGTANSSTLLALMKLYREHEIILIDDVRTGKFFLADRVPPEVWSAVSARMQPYPERAAELADLRLNRNTRRIADLWPALRLVVTWTCASAGVTVEALRCELSPRTRILELGYLASEFRGTFTLGRRAGSGLPTYDTHLFEFVEREKWDSGEAEFLTLDRIRKGIEYYIIVTTPSGLYRYFINDLVRVTGFLHRMPLLKFLQKGKGVTNITGEKLYEAQVLAAVLTAMTEFGRVTRFVMMLADEHEGRYCLYVESDVGTKPDAQALAQSVDAKLMQLNIEYFGKRESGRLRPLSAAWLTPDAGEAYKQFCVHRGQREGQFKTVALAYRKDFGFQLEAFVEVAES